MHIFWWGTLNLLNGYYSGDSLCRILNLQYCSCSFDMCLRLIVSFLLKAKESYSMLSCVVPNRLSCGRYCLLLWM